MRDRHIKGQRRRVEHRRFNEGFMQHASTSPFYPLFASLDVGAQMMKGKSGEVLWDDTIRLGIELRKKLRAIRREFDEKERDPARRWFFDPFVPDRVEIPDVAERRARAQRGLGIALDRPARARSPLLGACSRARTGTASRRLEAGFAITDPAKLTLLTPGFDRKTGEYADARRSGAGGRAISARKPGRAGEERPQLAAVPADARRRIRARRARWSPRSSRSSAFTTTTRCSTTSSRSSSPSGRCAIAAGVCATSAPRCTPSTARPTSRAAEGAVCARAPARNGDVAARGRQAAGAQQRRLSADRRDRRPHRDDAVRRLSAGHRDHRARRAARRARAGR